MRHPVRRSRDDVRRRSSTAFVANRRRSRDRHPVDRAVESLDRAVVTQHTVDSRLAIRRSPLDASLDDESFTSDRRVSRRRVVNLRSTRPWTTSRSPPIDRLDSTDRPTSVHTSLARASRRRRSRAMSQTFRVTNETNAQAKTSTTNGRASSRCRRRCVVINANAKTPPTVRRWTSK